MSFTTNSNINAASNSPQLQSQTGVIASLTYQNSGQQLLASGVATSGMVFLKGELASGAILSASIGGVQVAVQVDAKTTYDDGSVKMAVLSLARPAIAAGAMVEAVLSVAAAGTATPPALNLDAALAGHSFTVAISGAGGTTNIDVLAALHDALAHGTASFWQSGALSSQARVEIALPGSQRLVFDVTAFANGGIEVEAQFNNDRAMEAVGGRAAYSVAVTMDGRSVAQESVNQGQYQNWHRTFSSDGRNGGQGLGDAANGWLNIRQDMEHLEATGAVAQYDQGVGVATSLLDAYASATTAPGWNAPLATDGVTQFMPATGGRGDIGFTTAANTAWLITQDIRAANYALDQAEAAGGIPWNHWDAAHKGWISTDNYPLLWTDYRGGTGTPGQANSTGLTQQPDALSGWSLDSAHQPDLSYVPYVLTGERWILDNLQAQAAWNVVGQWPVVRGNGDDLVVRENQVRGAAWSLRQIDEAAWASPDGSAAKAYFTAVSQENWSWLVSQIPAWTVQQGEAHGWLPGAYGAPGALPPWQQDYFASTAIAAVKHGNADALTYLNWASNFLVGRFTHAAQGFAQHDGAAYAIAISDASNTPYQTWARIGAEMTARGWSNGTGWSQSQGDYPQLALATLAGIAEVTGSATAAAAYRALLAESPPFTTAADFNRDPTFAIEAPGSVPPVLPPPVVPPVVPPIGPPATVLYGTPGDDQFQVLNPNDQIVERPGEGNDTAWVAVNGWTLSPEVENGRLYGQATSLTGNAIANILVANAAKASTLFGGGGNDELWGSGVSGDVLDGGAGDDIIRSSGGATVMIGGTGNDQFVVTSADDIVIENAGEGVDTAWVGANGWTVGATVEIVRLFGAATSVTLGSSSTQVVANGGGNTTILARLGDNVFYGQAGNDIFSGGAGNDIFYAAAGGNGTRMTGGAGNDAFIVKNLGDRAFENAGGGYDTAYVAISGWTVGDNIEVAYLSGPATSLTGSATGGNLVANITAATTLTAGTGLTTFWGSSFGDKFNAGVGGGTMYGYGGADDFHFGLPRWGLVQIADFSHAQGDHLDFRGSGITGRGQLTINNFADKVQILQGTNEIILYGVTAPLVASDFLF